MLKIRPRLFLLLIASLSIACNKWKNTLPGGLMGFQGELIVEACTVEAGDRQLVVRMEQLSFNRLKDAGDCADLVPFSLHLQNCSPNLSDRVGIVFHGAADGKNPDALSVSEGEKIASCVGIALLDEQGQLIPINSEPQFCKPLTKVTPILKFFANRILQFFAKYRATANTVIGGTANAQARFSLTYQLSSRFRV